MPWVPSFSDLPDNKKFFRLCAKLRGVDENKLIGHLHRLWWWGTTNADKNGSLGAISDEEIAYGARWDGEVAAFCRALEYAGFLDKGPKGVRLLHDWPDFYGAFQTKREQNRDRARRYRVRHTGTDNTRDVRVTGEEDERDVTRTPSRSNALEERRGEEIEEIEKSSTETETAREPEFPPEDPPPPKTRPHKFTPPTPDEVQTYLDELGERRFTGEAFVDAYRVTGWKAKGGDPIKDWPAAVRNWRHMRDQRGEPQPGPKAKAQQLCRDCHEPMTKIETMEGTTCRACREDHGV